MPTQELSVNSGTSLSYLHQEHIVVRAMVALILSSTHEYDSVWDLSNRVCDRYLLTRSKKQSRELEPSLVCAGAPESPFGSL